MTTLSPFHQRGQPTVTVLLTKAIVASLDGLALEIDAVDQTISTGVVMAGEFESTTPRIGGAEFVLILEDDDLRRSVAEVARAGLHDRLFGGPTGLEA